VRGDGRIVSGPDGASTMIAIPPVGPSVLITPWNFRRRWSARKLRRRAGRGLYGGLEARRARALSALAIADLLVRGGPRRRGRSTS